MLSRCLHLHKFMRASVCSLPPSLSSRVQWVCGEKKKNQRSHGGFSITPSAKYLSPKAMQILWRLCNKFRGWALFMIFFPSFYRFATLACLDLTICHAVTFAAARWPINPATDGHQPHWHPCPACWHFPWVCFWESLQGFVYCTSSPDFS